MKEREFQKRIIKMVRDDGGIVFNVHGHGMQTPGWPDLYIALPESELFDSWQGWVELKVGKNKATPLQEHRITQLQKVGCPACVLRLLGWPMCQIEHKDSALNYLRLVEVLGEVEEI